MLLIFTFSSAQKYEDDVVQEKKKSIEIEYNCISGEFYR